MCIRDSGYAAMIPARGITLTPKTPPHPGQSYAVGSAVLLPGGPSEGFARSPARSPVRSLLLKQESPVANAPTVVHRPVPVFASPGDVDPQFRPPEGSDPRAWDKHRQEIEDLQRKLAERQQEIERQRLEGRESERKTVGGTTSSIKSRITKQNQSPVSDRRVTEDVHEVPHLNREIETLRAQLAVAEGRLEMVERERRTLELQIKERDLEERRLRDELSSTKKSLDMAAEGLQQRIRRDADEERQREERLVTLEVERDAARKRIEELESRTGGLSNLVNEKEALDLELQHLRGQLLAREAVENDSRRKIGDLEKVIEELRSSEGTLRSEISSIITSAEEFRQKAAAAEESVRESQLEKEMARIEIERLTQELRRLESEAAEKRTTDAEAGEKRNGEVEALRTQLELTHEQLHRCNTELVELRPLKFTVKDLEARVEALLAQKLASAEEIQSVTSSKDEEIRSLRELHAAEIAKVREESQKEQNMTSEREEEIRRLQTTHEGEVEKLKKEIEALKGQLSSAQGEAEKIRGLQQLAAKGDDEIVKLTEENKRLSQQLKEANQAGAKHQKDLEAQLTAKTRELEEARASAKRAEAQAEAKIREANASLEGQIKSLKAELTDEKSKVSAEEEKFKKLQHTLEQKKGELTRTSEKLAQKEEALKEKERELKEAKKSVQALEQKGTSSREERVTPKSEQEIKITTPQASDSKGKRKQLETPKGTTPKKKTDFITTPIAKETEVKSDAGARVEKWLHLAVGVILFAVIKIDSLRILALAVAVALAIPYGVKLQGHQKSIGMTSHGSKVFLTEALFSFAVFLSTIFLPKHTDAAVFFATLVPYVAQPLFDAVKDETPDSLRKYPLGYILFSLIQAFIVGISHGAKQSVWRVIATGIVLGLLSGFKVKRQEFVEGLKNLLLAEVASFALAY
eukprot:TRINITY_DN11843_c0_g1_i1.p1 TRINITY_DN11843_c0_g1~~TRINITY_DN11843_c0_g1_i1.p1  ORF type:complete len:923 (+),score=298.72 TRINITY_DN11843_c0_g1_i1:67-2835(+)